MAPLNVSLWAGTLDLSSRTTLAELSISEEIGSPMTCTLMIVDVDASIDLDVLTALAQLDIDDGTEVLFSGPITTHEIATIHSDATTLARTIAISCEGYERLNKGSPVAWPEGGTYQVQPDGSIVNTLGYTLSGGTDAEQVVGVYEYWLGPTLDLVTFVKVLRDSVDWPMPIDRTDIAACLDLIASTISGVDVLDFIDCGLVSDRRLRVHHVAGFRSGQDPPEDMLEPAPYELSAVAFGSGVVLASRMANRVESGGILGGVNVTGADMHGNGRVHGSGLAYAPWESIQSDRAINEAQRDAFAFRYLITRVNAGLTGTATIAAGLPDDLIGEPASHTWHRGQLLYVTDPASGFSHHPVVIRSVTRRLVSPGDDPPSFEYEIAYGDQPLRAFSREIARPKLPEFAVGAGTKYSLKTDNPRVSPGKPAKITAELDDAAGNAVAVAEIPVEWSLAINTVDVTDPLDTTNAYYLVLGEGSDMTDQTGHAFVEVDAGDAWTDTDDFSVTAETPVPV